MKRIYSGVYAAMLVLVSMSLALPALAQHEQHHRAKDEQPTGMQGAMMGKEMMGSGMTGEGMQAMMARPLHRTLMLAHMLPSMAEPLSLTEEQVQQLERLRNELDENVQPLSEKVASAEKGIDEALVAAGDPGKVKAGLRSLAEKRADIQVLVYEASQRMKAVLSPEQVGRLEAMTPMQFHQAMMSSPDHMKMMRGMGMMAGMNCPMMSGGMMSGGSGMSGHMQGMSGKMKTMQGKMQGMTPKKMSGAPSSGK